MLLSIAVLFLRSIHNVCLLSCCFGAACGLFLLFSFLLLVVLYIFHVHISGPSMTADCSPITGGRRSPARCSQPIRQQASQSRLIGRSPSRLAGARRVGGWKMRLEGNHLPTASAFADVFTSAHEQERVPHLLFLNLLVFIFAFESFVLLLAAAAPPPPPFSLWRTFVYCKQGHEKALTFFQRQEWLVVSTGNEGSVQGENHCRNRSRFGLFVLVTESRSSINVNIVWIEIRMGEGDTKKRALWKGTGREDRTSQAANEQKKIKIKCDQRTTATTIKYECRVVYLR